MTAFHATAEYGTSEVPSSGYSLSCEPAGYVTSGQSIQMPRSIAASVAAFAITAMAALGAGGVVCGVASYALSGKAIAERLSAAPAAYVLAGQPAQAAIPMASAVFTLTGKNTLSIATASLAPASFALFGKPVFRTFKIGLYPGEPATAEYGTAEFPRLHVYQVDAQQAAFAWSGQPAVLTTSPQAASFLLAGGAANQAMSNAAAAFLLTGQATRSSFNAAASKASFVLTPQQLQSFLPLDPAAFVWSGRDVLLRESLLRAQFTLAGQDAYSVKWLGCAPGSFVWTPQASRADFNLAAGRASFTFIGWSIVDVTGPSGDHIYLIEVQAHNGTSLQTFYLSTEGFTSLPIDTPSNQYYEPRIVDPGNFERALFDGSDLRGRAKSGSGDIVITSGDPGNGETLDDWFNHGWSRRNIRIMSLSKGAKSLSAAAVLFTGKLDRISSTKPLEQISLAVGDRLADLQAPLLTQLYAGTTLSSSATAEGNTDLKGKIKQRCWGVCANVPLQPANPYDMIYLASNSSVFSIAVYDGGAALTNDGDSASISALQAASISAGHYRTCLSAGLVRVGALPEKALTADVVEGATSASRSAGQIAYRMLLVYGIPGGAISTGSIAALDVKNAAECCYFVDDDRDAIQAVQDVLDSIGAWMVPDRDGTLVFGRFEAPSSAPQSTFELDAVAIGGSLDRVDNDLPAWRVLVEYAPAFTVQGDNDVLASVSAERRAYLAKQFRTATPAEDASVQTKHLSAREVTIKTYLVDPTAAAVEAVRQLALLSADRQRYNITMPLSDAWPSTPGSSITLRNPRLGLSMGKPFTVLNRVDQYETDTVEFSLWG